MKNTVIIPETCLHTLNAFDVGNNPEHVNHGLMKTQLSELLTQHKASLAHSDYISISGHALELLDEESPELLEELSGMVEQKNIHLAGVLFYNTSLSLLSPEKFTQQWNQTTHLIHTYFNQRVHTLYVGSQPIPLHLSEVISQLKLTIIGDTSLHMVSSPLGMPLSNKEIQEDVGLHSPYVSSYQAPPLMDQITTELLALEPFLSHDEDLSTSWQLMGQDQVLQKLDGTRPQETYDTYFTMMNILNDVAHTIRNIELTKRGEFETVAQIVDEPSRRVLDVLSKASQDNELPGNDEVDYRA